MIITIKNGLVSALKGGIRVTAAVRDEEKQRSSKKLKCIL